MAQQKLRRRFHQDKPVPWSGRKRVKKKRQLDTRSVPDGWSQAMMIRHGERNGG